ncbi:XRE family transcriptional regulator [Chitinophaga lutea]|uniref:XRE family transcriptional regulator n=1 Tax=Chitinophaga lutea TaxID=2488634 RepID=A0A3N4PCK9_9BACT|nr:helix-turn-helix transcriptional regulator [Chitinophaga lutea]RPE05805.1 XRE family transcriptional regulator [Chitinophaga lutea]
MQDIGRKLYLLRLIHNYTQAYIADQLEIGHSTYLALEQDATRIPLFRLEKLLAIYNLTLGDFFSFDVDSLLQVIHGQKSASTNQVGISSKSLIQQLQSLNKLLLQLLEEFTAV